MSSPLSIVVTANIGDAKRQLSDLRNELTQLNEAAKGGVQVSAKTDGKSLVAQLRLEQEQIKANAAITVASERTKQRELLSTARAQQQVAQSGEEVIHNMQGSRYALYQVAAAYGAAGAAALGFFKSAVSSMADYEASFKQVERTTEGTVSQLTPLYEDLKQLGTEIPASFEDLAQITALGGQMGFAIDELGQFTETVARFSASTGMAADASATAFGKLSNLLHVSVDEFENLGSAIAYVGVTTVATDPQITKTASELAGVGYAAGLSTEAVLGMAASFASLDVQPERARSSVLRLFRTLDLALADGGDAAKTWANQLHISVEELQNLRDTNPDEFFVQFVRSLERVKESGGNLTTTFQDLELGSVRDVDAFQRLAGSADLLTGAIDDARLSYAEGDFLGEASGKVFDSLTAKVEMLKTAWNNLTASIGETPVIGGTLKFLVDGLTGVLRLFERLPGPVKAFIGSFTLIIGLFALYKTGIALLQAATLAWAFLAKNSNNELSISFRGLMDMIQRTTAMMRNLGNETVAAATKGAAAIDGQTAALGRQSGAGAGGALKSAASFGAGFLKVGLWTAAISGAIALGDAIWEGVKGANSFESAMQKAGSEFNKLTSAGEAFAQAMKTDLSSGDDSIGTISTRLDDAKESLDGYNASVAEYQRTATTVFTDASGATHNLSERIVNLASAGDIAKLSQEQLAKKVDDTTAALQRQQQQIGEGTLQQVQDTIVNSLTGDEGFTGADFNDLKDAGIDMGTLIRDGINEGLANKNLDTSQIEAEVKALGDRIKLEDDLYSAQENRRTASDLAQSDRVAAFDMEIASLQKQIAVNGEVSDAERRRYDLLNAVLEKVFGATGLLADQMGVLSARFKDTDLDDYTDDAEGAADATETLQDAIKEASEAFGNFMDAVTQQADLTAGLSSAYEELGKSIAENGGSFDVMTEAGRANLSAFEGVMNAYGAIIDAEIQQGRLTAEQGAQMMAVYMSDLVGQLGKMKVPDEQIKALVGMLNKVTGFGWKISIGADVGPAIAGINSVAAAANQVAAGVRASGISLLTGAGISAFWQGAKAYAGATNFAPNSTSAFNESMLGGYNSALDSAAKKAAGAGGAGKKAGKTIEDAMRDAEKATKDMESAFQAAADTFANFGKNAFSHINAEGKVFETLRDLGVSLAENGKHFNTYSDAGRANLKALEDAFIAYGEQQRTQLESGEIGFKRAQKNMQSFAQQMYQDLREAGVPAKEINAIFKAMGVDTKNIEKASKDVKVFKDVLSVANEAAKNAAKSVKALKEETEDYVKRLKEGFDDINQSIFGRQNAADATAQAFNRMSDAIKSVNDEIQRLKDESQDYGTIIAGQEAIAQGAGVAYAQALAQNDPELAALFAYRRDTAQAQANEARRQQQERANQIAELEASKNATTGNTDAALDNRRALQDLMATYQDQIIALAQTGATQKKVQEFTDSTKQSFIEQAKELGFTEDQLKSYTDSFDRLVTTVKETPKKVKVDVELTGAEAADKAVKDLLASNNKLKVTPELKDKKPFRQAMKDITSGWEAYVKARRDAASFNKVVEQMKNGPAKTRTATIKAKVDPVSLAAARSQVNLTGTANISVRLGGKDVSYDVLKALKGGYTGGSVSKLTGMASGGRIPGTPPMNPYEDNILARGPGGLFAVRSGEYVQSQPAVDYYGLPFMNAINEMRIPRENIAGLTKAISGISRAQVASTGGITVVANYPQAEPTSKTINRARELATGMGAL